MERIVCAKCGQTVCLCQDRCPVCGSSEKRVLVLADKGTRFFDRLFPRDCKEEKPKSSS